MLTPFQFRIYSLSIVLLLGSNLFASDKPFFYQETSSADIKQAKVVSSFITQLRRSNLDRWSLRLLSKIKSEPLLPGLNDVIKLSNDIESAKNTESFFKACGSGGSVQKWKPTNNVEDIISGELQSICKVKFIENLIASKKFKSLDADERSYFKRHARFYLLKDRRHLLKRYLKLVDRDSDTHKFISSAVTDAYIKFDIIAEKELVALLDIGNDLTGHIQSSGLRGLSGNLLFEKEFRSLIYAAMADLNDPKKTKEIVGQVISFQQQNSSFIRQRVAWLNFIMLGKELAHAKNWDMAAEVLSHSERISIGSVQIDEATFQSLFMRVLKGNRKELFSFIDENKILKRYDQMSSKLQFWVAYSLEAHGKKDVSSRLYERLLTNNPLSFYSIVAQREYQLINDKSFIAKPFVMPNIAKDSLSDDLKNTLKRLRLWIKVNDRFLAESEISRLKSISVEQALTKAPPEKISAEDFRRFTMLRTTEVLNFEEAYLTSFKVLYNALGDGSLPVSTATIEYLFPKPYLDQIKKIDSSIDPLIVLSLIRQESAFNPEARSHVGARGLMQLMPATARELKRGVRNHQLVDPNLNLKLGIKYFKRLLKKYDGSLIHTLAAYNAGEGNLKRWMGTKLTHEDPLVIIESIPFKETRKYVKLIYRNVYFYKYLANDLDFFKLPMAQSFNARAIATAGNNAKSDVAISEE
ncbi:MAG: hypothetical protein CME71_07435 [Halobacteriovorax sp.]|nr:hypothetical protein [Halobacteriovorax sp.]